MEVAKPVRGVLRAEGAGGRWSLARYEPAPELAPFVEFHWIVRWDLCGHPPYDQPVLSHPTIHLVFEEPRATVYGIDRGLFVRRLAGRGQVLGVKFTVGGFRPYLGRAVGELLDRTVPAAELLGPWPDGGRPDGATADSAADSPAADGAARNHAGSEGPGPDGRHLDRPGPDGREPGGVPPVDGAGSACGLDALCREILAEQDDHAMILRAERLLRARLPEADPLAARAAELVDRITADRTLLRVDQVAEQAGLSVRALQRFFAEYVGAPPKWVLRRARLHEAAERAAHSPVDWSALAADLGYADQSHLVRDFTAGVGVPPGRYAVRS